VHGTRFDLSLLGQLEEVRMAEETQAPEQGENKNEKKSGGMMKKLLIFGVPAFLVQLVVIYFLTAKFVVPMTLQSQIGKISKHEAKEQHGNSEEASDDESGDEEEGKEPKVQQVYVVKDLIINPAGTNGQRYLLTTIAFNVSSENALKELEGKELAVRDMLNSILTSKTMDQLIDVAQREALREEIQKKAKEILNRGRVKGVYFSKYVVQ
jgi:flagellar FliL protein